MEFKTWTTKERFPCTTHVRMFANTRSSHKIRHLLEADLYTLFCGHVGTMERQLYRLRLIPTSLTPTSLVPSIDNLLKLDSSCWRSRMKLCDSCTRHSSRRRRDTVSPMRWSWRKYGHLCCHRSGDRLKRKWMMCSFALFIRSLQLDLIKKYLTCSVCILMDFIRLLVRDDGVNNSSCKRSVDIKTTETPISRQPSL